MNRKQKIIVSVTSIFLVLLLLVGLTYAYFLTQINGNENSKSISVTTANLALVYGDGNGVITTDEPIIPGTTLDSKTFTVKNEGNAETDYVVVIEDVNITYATTVEENEAGTTTTFESNDFVYTLTCESDGEACDSINTETTFPINGGILVGNDIEVGKTHSYTLTVTYKETGVDQSNDMNKTLEAKVNIKDIAEINPYSANTSTLAYNIINNAMLNKNGTQLLALPITKVAEETSTYDTPGEQNYLRISSFALCDGYNAWLVGDTETTTSNEVSSYEDAVGKYIYDQCSGWTRYLDFYNADKNELVFLTSEKAEQTLTVTSDDYGISYYYRGAVEDNYVDFAGMCWRIVRIEGDGAIKLILEDKDSTCASSYGNWNIGTGHYGYNQTKVTNTSGQQSSSSKYIADYINSPTSTSTSMKTQFDTWLTSSGIDTSKLKMDTWCLGNTNDAYDSETGVLLTDTKNDLMYNNKLFYYEAAKRILGIGTKLNATLRCDGNNDKTFESYIGTLTVDEVVFAGSVRIDINDAYYLVNNSLGASWKTLSLSQFNEYGDYVFVVDIRGGVSDEDINFDNDENGSLRPAVSLASNTIITSGEGTKTNPYVVG